MPEKQIKMGVDVGSTTAKVALVNKNSELIHSCYKRHNTYIHSTLISIFEEIIEKYGDTTISIRITGSAGLGVSEKFQIPFIQEVVASAELVRQKHPEVHTLIDIGGEDSKMIFFHKDKSPDIRMNGSCAGGTGAFIDQMASLMNVDVSELNGLAQNSQNIYPIASRCGVFAKTDVQNLIARKISKEDIAASIFHAVAVQTMNTLARGYNIEEKLIFSGGPFCFIPELKKIFINNLQLNNNAIVNFENPELVPALGAAIDKTSDIKDFKVSELIKRIRNFKTPEIAENSSRLKPLFKNRSAFENWQKNRLLHKIEESSISNYKDNIAYLGIDSGSTTTKIVVTGTNNEILYKFYSNNKAQVIDTVKEGLQSFYLKCEEANKNIKLKASTATGYGEDLIKAAFNLDFGVVETIAHTSAAKFMNPNVSFIMDIGGQDMKAIFVKNGMINKIELNESCSSGCGSFIETFGKSLGYPIADFANLACQAESPCDLGTRCTVFMNSKVKQALRENASVADISAGLSISVIKNAIFKVLKLRDYDELGDNIVVQGGTFKNKSVIKALEQLTGKSVITPSLPELMGAYGASLIAKEQYEQKNFETKFSREVCENVNNFTTKLLNCKACENICTVTRFDFENNKRYYSGNKCEKVFSNAGALAKQKGENIFDYKNEILFDRNCEAKNSSKKNITIGIPRVLNIFNNYPFWNKLLTEVGFDVTLSDVSTMEIYKQGQGTIMSDSICFPAKLVHGHIYNLIDKKVDRILYPFVLFEKQHDPSASNSFNCPIVGSYSEVLKSAINTEKNHDLPLDAPTINFNNDKLLKKACVEYLKQFGVSKNETLKAVDMALKEQDDFQDKLQNRAVEIIEKSKKNDEYLVVLAGRPYHTDALINHKTPQIFSDLGVNVISEDSVPDIIGSEGLQVLTQWSYPNKLYNAAAWVANASNKVQFVLINSFGCGPDAIAIDECNDILKEKGKNNTLIRVDEITSTGSVKLRLRSFIESVKMNQNTLGEKKDRITTAPFLEKDKNRTILAPYFARVYSEMLASITKKAGFEYKNLPLPDKKSVEYGLKYANNEICYPATIVVGDIMKAVHEGNLNNNEVAFVITQTGGQCRATNYMSLIKKALVASGNQDIPVVSFNGNGTENIQPGFNINWFDHANHIIYAMVFGDCLNLMYNSSVVREANKGESQKLLDKYIGEIDYYIKNKKPKDILALLSKAVVEYNQIEINKEKVPQIGIVGEIYAKLNSFGHGHIVKWLQERGIEVIVPPLVDFFVQEFVNVGINTKAHFYDSSFKKRSLLWFFEKKIKKIIDKSHTIMTDYRFNIHMPYVRESLKKAERIINPAVNTFGEGWLIPAEIGDFAEMGVNNVISVQPFGCIANQVISKGVEKKMREVYPKMNLLFLDFDDGASEVNILNRLHFLIKGLEN
jgi:predicted CoA-substrate-specific enzyme activase